MSDQNAILAQAEQLAEEGRLLLVLGRALAQVASGAKESLGPWALNELRNLGSGCPRNGSQVLPRRPSRSSRTDTNFAIAITL